jgi:glutathione S-transferase
MQLYQFPISHYCEKARFALAYKGLIYETVNLMPGLHSRTTTKFGQGSSVPVLKHGDLAIQGSAAIINYLDEIVPARLLTPTDPQLRDEALDWERWLDAEVGPHVRRYCYHCLLDHRDIITGFFCTDGPWWGPLFMFFSYKGMAGKMREFMDINEDSAAASLAAMRAALVRLNGEYANRDFLVGDSFSRADLAAAALFGPMLRPAQYGLVWPEVIPEPLASISEEMAPSLEWARRMYRDYRS